MDRERWLQMSRLEFEAEVVSITSEDGACVIGLADNPTQPTQWVLLQRSLSPDDQEKKLGLDTYDFEVSGSCADHGSVERATLDHNDLLFTLRPNKGVGLAMVLVHLKENAGRTKEIAEKLKFVFGGTDTTLSITNQQDPERRM
jgi:hypothetical protein